MILLYLFSFYYMLINLLVLQSENILHQTNIIRPHGIANYQIFFELEHLSITRIIYTVWIFLQLAWSHVALLTIKHLTYLVQNDSVNNSCQEHNFFLERYASAMSSSVSLMDNTTPCHNFFHDQR